MFPLKKKKKIQYLVYQIENRKKKKEEKRMGSLFEENRNKGTCHTFFKMDMR